MFPVKVPFVEEVAIVGEMAAGERSAAVRVNFGDSREHTIGNDMTRRDTSSSSYTAWACSSLSFDGHLRA